MCVSGHIHKSQYLGFKMKEIGKRISLNYKNIEKDGIHHNRVLHVAESYKVKTATENRKPIHIGFNDDSNNNENSYATSLAQLKI